MIFYKTLVHHKCFVNRHYFKFNSAQSTLMCVHVLLKHVHILSECHGCTAPCTHAQLQLLDLPTTSLILEQFYLIIHPRIKMIYYDCCTLRLHKNFITCWLCARAHICQNYNSTSLMTVCTIYKHLIVTQCCIYEHIVMLIFICCRFCGISVFTVL